MQYILCYNSITTECIEISPSAARKMIERGEIKGVLFEKGDLTSDDKFIPDVDGFNMRNINIKTAAGKFRPYFEDTAELINVNSTYVLVKKLIINDKNYYELVSSKCAHIVIDEKTLIEFSKLAVIGGAWITESDIKLADCIEVVDNFRLGEVNAISTKFAGEENLKEDGSLKNDLQADTENLDNTSEEPVVGESVVYSDKEESTENTDSSTNENNEQAESAATAETTETTETAETAETADKSELSEFERVFNDEADLLKKKAPAKKRKAATKK